MLLQVPQFILSLSISNKPTLHLHSADYSPMGTVMYNSHLVTLATGLPSDNEINSNFLLRFRAARTKIKPNEKYAQLLQN